MATLVNVLLVISVITLSYQKIQAQNVVCNRPLGLRDRDIIRDSQLTSNGPTGVGVAPRYARLYSSSAWCITSNQFTAGLHYLQIDFLEAVNITAIEAQGQSRSGATSFYVQQCATTSSCQFILENFGLKEFQGENNGDQSIYTAFPNRVFTRYLRIFPLQFTNNPCMRLEVYGCSAIDFTPPPPTTPSTCNNSMGMYDGRIRDSQMTSTGPTYSSTTAQYARLRRVSAWCIRRNHLSAGTHYLEIDLLQNATLTAIVTQGQSNSGVTKYSFKYTANLEDTTWRDYTENNSTQALNITGGSRWNDFKLFSFSEPLQASKIRIYPLEYNSTPCMRLELLGC